jgi:hypothetical protein
MGFWFSGPAPCRYSQPRPGGRLRNVSAAGLSWRSQAPLTPNRSGRHQGLALLVGLRVEGEIWSSGLFIWMPGNRRMPTVR